MIAAIVWLFPVCSKLRKSAAGDIVPSLTRLKKNGSEFKFLVSIFRKPDQINIENRGNGNLWKLWDFVSHMYRTIKPPCRAATMDAAILIVIIYINIIIIIIVVVFIMITFIVIFISVVIIIIILALFIYLFALPLF